ncbi:MAG: UDP-N-acetylmuramoyl-tripeptide--D-alanyl-D-alanine ligase [Bacteroidota bacterium]
MQIQSLHQLFLENPIVCTDTRKIQDNVIFFALKGDNFNGNRFAAEALENGASWAIVDEKEYAISEKCILVDDVLKTLQELATYHRNHCKAKLIGLTGSNGKTTTKELIYAVLSKKYNTIATQGNLNNHIGVPLTLLGIRPDTELAIVEMGANHQKEIAFLSEIAQPDFGYITNFGKAHLEGFGGVEGVIKGKSELYDYLLGHKKSVFLNADDPVQFEKLASYIHKYGFSTYKRDYYNIEFLGARPFVKIKVEDLNITTHLIGEYNFPNCAVAIVMGKYFNVGIPQIKEALEAYVPENNRSQILEKGGHTIVLDAYNANPTSMKAALESFVLMENTPKILFLGDMFELGETALEEHQGIVDRVIQMDLGQVFLIGENFYRTKSSFQKFRTFADIASYLEQWQFPQDSLVLIKGSRGMALERLLDLF